MNGLMTNCHELIAQVFSEVCEQLVFMFADACDAQTPLDAPPYLRGSITFAGPCGGSIGLVAPALWCNEMAANALGVDEDEAELGACGTDALRELLNVLCGQFLQHLAGEKHLLSIAIPQTEAIETAEIEEIRGKNAHLMCTVEGHVVLLDWQITIPALSGDKP